MSRPCDPALWLVGLAVLLSFPSEHSSQAHIRANLACLNLNDLIRLSRGWRVTLKGTFHALAAGTAWARVEGGVHYPSDVLFGAALGNFVARFVHGAFLPADATIRLDATLGVREASLSVAWRF